MTVASVKQSKPMMYTLVCTHGHCLCTYRVCVRVRVRDRDRDREIIHTHNLYRMVLTNAAISFLHVGKLLDQSNGNKRSNVQT